MEKKLKSLSNIITVIILALGAVYCIWHYTYHTMNCSDCPYHESYLKMDILLFIPFALLAAVIFYISRLLSSAHQKYTQSGDFSAVKKLKLAAYIAPMAITFSGTAFYLWSCIAHSLNCTHCNGHTLYPIMLLIIFIPIILLSLISVIAVFLSRLILLSVNKKQHQEGK